MKSFTIVTATAFLATLGLAAVPPQTTKEAMQQPSSTPEAGDAVVQGCWGSAGELTKHISIKYNSRGECGVQVCNKKGFKVGASYRGEECWCGNKYPPLSALLNDSACAVKCPGFGWDACGGANAWTIYNTGLDLYGVEFSADPSTSSSGGTATPTNQPSGSGSPAPAASSSQAPPSPGGSSSSNTAGIAAGVVVGVVAVAGIAGGIWFFMRRRRNQEIEEEHRRNAAVNAFIHGQKPPSSSGGLSMTDSRMDPIIAQRRMSDGSIADNQDYSRRILRVTNA